MFTENQLETICEQLHSQGYCVLEQGLRPELASALHEQLLKSEGFKAAGVGRGTEQTQDKQVRSDQILWIEPVNPAQEAWLAQMEQLRSELNRYLYLGLFSFESHYAHYSPGAFYEKHLDAFRGQSNRVLSCVTYLNEGWQSEWGGALDIYDEQGEQVLTSVVPKAGAMVIFLSEQFPHEVLPASRDRYSIAGWFRVNNSNATQVDPPR